jgi:hypothetical protein
MCRYLLWCHHTCKNKGHSASNVLKYSFFVLTLPIAVHGHSDTPPVAKAREAAGGVSVTTPLYEFLLVQSTSKQKPTSLVPKRSK